MYKCRRLSDGTFLCEEEGRSLRTNRPLSRNDFRVALTRKQFSLPKGSTPRKHPRPQ